LAGVGLLSPPLSEPVKVDTGVWGRYKFCASIKEESGDGLLWGRGALFFSQVFSLPFWGDGGIFSGLGEKKNCLTLKNVSSKMIRLSI